MGATSTFFTDGNYGEAYPKSSDMTDSGSGVPFLAGGNLKDGKLSLDGASYITPEKHCKLTSGHLLEDDIVIAVRGSLGALGYVNTDNSGWNINSQLAILRTDKSELYGKFLIQYLLSWTGQNELLKRQTGSALKQLPIGAIKDVEVPITSIAEQEKIGEYFADLDNLITLHQRKYEKLTNVKKSMLEKMFPQNGSSFPEIRFKGFTDAWEQRKLSEMCGTFEYGLNAAAKEFDGKNKYIRITDIDDTSREFLLSDLSSPDICLDGMSKYLLSSGDIVFARTGASVGKTYIYRENDGIVYFAGFLIRAKVNQDNDAEFVFQSTLSPSYEKYIRITSQRSGQPGVNAQEYGEYDLFAPSKEEQQRIGHFLRGIDSLITLHQRELEKLQNIKKSMLEKMFV